MVATNPSPGVYVNEIDSSAYVPSFGTTSFGLVGTSTKGPLNTPTILTTEQQFVEQFGYPNSNHFAGYAASRFFRAGNRLIFNRVAAAATVTTATADVTNAAAAATAVIFTATSPGTWANGTTGLQIQVSNGIVANTYDLRFYWNGVSVEYHQGVVVNDANHIDYIETRLADSEFATAVVQAGETDLSEQTVAFANGDDGINPTTAEIIGTVAGQTRTGLKVFEDADGQDVSMLAVPGNSHTDVVNELIRVCELRTDCFALIDTPQSLDPVGVMDWHNGTSAVANAPTVALNTSYGGVYWGWGQVNDAYNNQDIYIPPSGFAAEAFTVTDRDYDVYYAPAGTNRGRLTGVKALEYNPSRAEQDLIYGGRGNATGPNRINPLVDYQLQGTYINGQLTLLRQTTSLENVAVRRMLISLKKIIPPALRPLIFEPNNTELWRDMRNIIEPPLERLKQVGGLNDYQVIVDESNNPPALQAQRTVRGQILLIPVIPAERIELTFQILPQGASFSEFTNRLG